jgi:uncharacterized protein with PIN domain
MCGGIRAHLRICGHDAAYALDRGVEADDAVLALAREEGRRLVTRDRELARRAEDAVLVTDRETEGQLRELAAAGLALGVDLDARPPRCGRCNGSLATVTGETPDYAPDADDQTVWRCRSCGQHFWQGSHWADVRATLASL